ncbi:hypothetical protein B296_00027745 [Ensete ventricosum]|uniref:2,4-dienoyl-CoA reductase [(3E)-enoyl-CoA-producing] n=1 Tax=Ensete ventricosum TaxID=4639 RepID=A0A427AP31_ENSVE|nr:hypothetical protein B296_00027745 [Ensete ventricosum]
MESPFKADILKGKVAVVTGGGSGIGLEISTQFGRHGAAVAIMGRRRQVLDAAVAALRSEGIRVSPLSPKDSTFHSTVVSELLFGLRNEKLMFSSAAVDSITRSLALEWGTDYDIRVNGIAPGPIADTPGMRKLAPGEMQSKSREYRPLYKLGERWDIAMAALYLASDAGL